MVYVFFGKDAGLVREKALTFMRTLVKGDAEAVRVSGDTYAEGILEDLAESVSLFGGEQVVLLDTPSSEEEFSDAVLAALSELKASANHFVVIEEALNASAKKAYGNHAEVCEEVASADVKKFNTFALTDALLDRDKKTLWMLLVEARERGESNEAIVGILFWQIKTLRLVEKTKSAEEAGVKPFVYNKAKRALSSFKSGEIERLSRELLSLYHKGHTGKVDMNSALEKWVLSI